MIQDRVLELLGHGSLCSEELAFCGGADKIIPHSFASVSAWITCEARAALFFISHLQTV